MDSILSPISITILIICALAVNFIWYYIKDILLENGYKTYAFWGHLNDLFNMAELIKKTNDVEKKKRYRLLLRSLIVILILFIGTGFIFLV